MGDSCPPHHPIHLTQKHMLPKLARSWSHLLRKERTNWWNAPAFPTIPVQSHMTSAVSHAPTTSMWRVCLIWFQLPMSWIHAHLHLCQAMQGCSRYYGSCHASQCDQGISVNFGFLVQWHVLLMPPKSDVFKGLMVKAATVPSSTTTVVLSVARCSVPRPRQLTCFSIIG
jgi:hypothetical protein